MERVVDSLTHLKELHRKMHDDGNVSVMVGAGFSKNVSNKFLSWSGLLADMLKELYPEEFEVKKKIKVQKINRIDTLIKTAPWSKENQELINEYKTNKYFKSAFVQYCEAEFSRAEFYENELDNDDEQTLKRLLDECIKKKSFKTNLIEELESVIAEDVAWEMMRRRDPLEVVSEYQKKKGYREAVEYYIESHMPYVDFKSGSLSLSQDKGRVERIEDKMDMHQELLRCPWQYIFTTNYDQLLEYTYYLQGLSCNVITKDYNLSTSNMENSIIKLHGDLWTPQTHDEPEDVQDIQSIGQSFSFDGCNEHRYIFSKEDYDRYPTDHDAFTQFMKIVLLRGSICLIGFSGDDPNFMSWVKWIRNIFIKSPQSYSPKIYLISLDEKEPSKDKQLFYNNHNVAVISLFDKEVRYAVDATNNNLSKRVLLSKFLKLMSQEATAIFDKTYQKLILREKFRNNIWRKSVDKDLDEKAKKDDVNTALLKLEIFEDKRFNVYLNQGWSLLNALCRINDEKDAKLFIYTLKALSGTSLYCHFENDLIEDTANNMLEKVWADLDQKLKSDFSYMNGLMHILTNRKNINNTTYFEIEGENYRRNLPEEQLIYLECLNLLYSFDFSHLQAKLSQLDATKYSAIFKERIAMISAAISSKEGIISLRKIIQKEKEVTIRYTLCQLVKAINPNDNILIKKNYPEFDLQKMLNILVDDFRRSIDKHNCDSLSKESDKVLYAFRILRFMQEYGAGIGTPNFPKPPFEVWYEVVKTLYKQCTNSVLYYSLMYSYDGIKKIALLYAFLPEDGRGSIVYSIFKAIESNYTIPNDYENKVKLLAVIVILLTFNPSNSKEDFELTDEFVKTIVQDYCEYARSIIDEKQDIPLFEEMSYLLYSFFPLLSPKQLNIFFSYLLDWYTEIDFEDSHIGNVVLSVFFHMRFYTVLINLEGIDFNELSELNCKLSCFIEKMGSYNDFQLSFTFLPFIIPLNLAQKYIKRIKEVHGNGDISYLYSLSQGHLELLYKVYNSQSKNETPKDKSLEDYVFNAFINEGYFWEPINVGYLYYSESFVTPWGSSNEINLSSNQICELYDSLSRKVSENKDEFRGEYFMNDYSKKKYWIVLKEMQSFMDKYKDEISKIYQSYECTKRKLEQLLNQNYKGWDIKACLSSSSQDKRLFAIDKTRYKIRTNFDFQSYWKDVISLVDSCCYSNNYLNDKMAVICEACCKRGRNNKLKHDILSLEPLYLKFMEIDLVEISDDAYFVFNCLNRIAKLFPKEQIKSDVIKKWLDSDRSKIYKTIEMNWL